MAGVSVPRVYWSVSAPENGVVVISGEQAHHLRQVLRLGPGAPVGIFDGRGHEWVGQVAAVTKHHLTVGQLVAVPPVPESDVAITLAIGVLKGDQMDAVVRDATMLGVTTIVPMQTSHVSVPPRAWQSGAARERWQRVAVASAAQCRRAVVPEVSQVSDLDTCLRMPHERRLICVEPLVVLPTRRHERLGDWRTATRPASALILIGPEGGWSVAEVEQALEAGAQPMHLGPRTLRAETAPVVALSVVAAVWGW
jgi:16S rRNA (uracil1498-N3)-methyltransferase